MREVILIGNPNVGKTTLFNTMTKSNERASNWHGVTVNEKSKKFKIDSEEYLLTDLPGMYSLKGFSNEEKLAANYLISHKDTVIVNICDANNLKRNLKITTELIEADYEVIVAVNMSNELKLQTDVLSRALGVPVIGIDARKVKSVKFLNKIISEICDKKTQNVSKIIEKRINYDVLNNFLLSLDKIEPYKTSDKIDRIVLNKFFIIPSVILVFFLVFYITFGPVGNAFSFVFNLFFNKIFEFLRKIISCVNISFIVKNFLIEGVINSFSTICSFLPQILLLMILINFLEDVGFMSRLAFALDGFLKRFGLTGKSLFSLMMGYGCTASAVMTTRNLENPKLRKRTVLLLPFSTCSAKLPVFLVISSLFFEKYKYLFVLALYLFSILISLVCAAIFKRVIKDEKELFIMEMPKYRLPYLKKILMDSLRVIAEFALKVGTLILFFSSLLWLLQNFSISFDYLQGENFDKSILYLISSKISFLFKPLGLGSAGIVAALLLGLVAKELIVVGLAMINGVDGLAFSLTSSLVSADSICHFTQMTSIVFLIFILLYSPCISALGTVKNEFGKKTAIFMFVFQMLLSYFVSFVVFKFLTSLWMKYTFFIVLIVVIFALSMLKLKHKTKRCGSCCNVCRKI